MTCKITSLIVLASSLLFAGHALSADDYPSKPINMYLGFTPGGANGNSATIFFETAKKYLPRPQPIILNYKPGAQSAIAADYVLKQSADGYTQYLYAPDLSAKMAKDGHQLNFKMEDFIFIGTYMYSPLAVVVKRDDSRFNTLDEFVEYARKNPGKLSFGAPGPGSAAHLSTEFFMSATGTKMYMVPFPGAAPQTTALLGGHLDLVLQSIASGAEHIMPGGGLKALGVLASRRWPTLPDVPTLQEKGYNVQRSMWYALTVAKGTPQPVLNVLSKMMNQTTNDPDVKTKLLKIGCFPVGWGPEETLKMAKDEFTVSYEFYKKQGMLK
jgi:tripartite-type tricarboxylate transporter receptor subunit TctC